MSFLSTLFDFAGFTISKATDALLEDQERWGFVLFSRFTAGLASALVFGSVTIPVRVEWNSMVNLNGNMMTCLS